MSMIRIEDLTFSYPNGYDNIFENVSLSLDTDWRLGLVGRNGRGKTTLLRLLLGEYEYSGRITASVQFDYFPYPVADSARLTEHVLQDVCPEAQQWELERELSLLEVESEVLWRPFDTLSYGERTKVLLAALFLNEGHFLLIDEPTNHLDVKARALVAAYLKRKKGFILVSHDRTFLDGCVDHIMAINRSDIEIQSGGFSSWMEEFARRQESELAQNEHLRRDIERLKHSAKRSAAWSERTEASKHGIQSSGLKADSGYVGHKAAKLMKRSKSIEQRRQKAIEEKAGLLKNAETAEELKLFPLRYRSDTLATLSDVSVCYDGREVFSPLSFDVRRGERIALDGRNGSGKSSLLGLISGKPTAYTGAVSVGAGLVISCVPQDTSHLVGSLTAFARESCIDEALFKAILRKLDFERLHFDKDMAELSGGQKKKVMIARSLCEQAHLYVWDEPLNFIDIYSRMQIEHLIAEFSPTMIFVEHDKAFRDAIATKTVHLTRRSGAPEKI